MSFLFMPAVFLLLRIAPDSSIHIIPTQRPIQIPVERSAKVSSLEGSSIAKNIDLIVERRNEVRGVDDKDGKGRKIKSTE